MECFLATSSMTEGKPPTDGGIIQLNWDSGQYDTQVSFSNNSIHNNKVMAVRRNDGNGNWEDWIPILSKKNFSYSNGTLTITI